MNRRVPTPLISRLIIMLRMRPICSISPLIGILKINGMKFWTLNSIPSCTRVISFYVRYRLHIGCTKLKFSTNVVAESISA